VVVITGVVVAVVVAEVVVVVADVVDVVKAIVVEMIGCSPRQLQIGKPFNTSHLNLVIKLALQKSSHETKCNSFALSQIIVG
jgi:hypothetical protein